MCLINTVATLHTQHNTRWTVLPSDLNWMSERQKARSRHCRGSGAALSRWHSFSTNDSSWRSFWIRPSTNLKGRRHVAVTNRESPKYSCISILFAAIRSSKENKIFIPMYRKMVSFNSATKTGAVKTAPVYDKNHQKTTGCCRSSCWHTNSVLTQDGAV